VDKYPTWKDNTIKPEPVRVVGEDIVPTQEKYTLNLFSESINSGL
jgi:hypothetical protein